MNQLYFSREDRLGTILREEDRVRYLDVVEDETKCNDSLDAVASAFDEVENELEAYLEFIADGTPEEIKHHREQLVYAWAMMQATVSKFAYVLRIDGNDAFQRLVDAIKHSNTANMEGL